MRKTQNSLGRAVFLLALAALPACGESAQEGRGDSPFAKARTLDALRQVAGLEQSVEIVRDRYGVPHIFAGNDRDLNRALGYVHAQDRLFLMDALRHVATGTLSEYLGQDALPSDVALRTIMMTNEGIPVSEAITARLDPSQRELLGAYSEGINIYLDELRQGIWKLPPGYDALVQSGMNAAQIPPWQISDTIAIGRLQELDLTSGTGSEDLERGQWFSALPLELFADLVRFAPADSTVVLPNWPAPAQAGRAQSPISQQGPQLEGWRLDRALAKLARPGDNLFDRHQLGSNNWVVGGASTQSGAPMVANDPHLRFTTPATFYHAHLNTSLFSPPDHDGKVNVMGVTTPGLPDVLIGHNERVAWGATVAGWDVTDVYLEQLNEQGDATLFNGEMVPILRFPQDFRLGWSPDAPVVQKVIEYVPHHGPIFDKDMENRRAITVKWTGRIPSLETGALHELDRAQDIPAFMRAVGQFTVLAQSWNAADIQGNLGYFPHAQVPIRANLTQGCRPYLPMDGSGPCEWLGFVPADQMPAKTQGAQGWLVTANNDIPGQLVDNDPLNDSLYLHSDRALGFRAGRITEQLAAWRSEGKKLSVADMAQLQADTKSLLAGRLLPHLFKAAQAQPDKAQGLGPALQRLASWDLVMASGVDPAATALDQERSIAASIFNVYAVELAKAAFGDELATHGAKLSGSLQFKTVLALLEAPEQFLSKEGLWDNINTAERVEGRNEILLDALHKSLAHLASPALFASAEQSTWKWGRIHQMKIEDPLSSFSGQAMRSLGPFARGGGNFTVDVAGQRDLSLDFSFVSGAQMRFVAELLPDGPRAVSSLPGGQSDDPDSPHYEDLLALWLRNETFPYYFKTEDILKNMESYTRWEPGMPK